MNAFWIAGIAINVVGLAAVVFWARKAWKQADLRRADLRRAALEQDDIEQDDDERRGRDAD